MTQNYSFNLQIYSDESPYSEDRINDFRLTWATLFLKDYENKKILIERL